MLAVVGAYFALLLAVAHRASRNADNDSFFIGNRSSHWLLVAFGMVGTTLSGVTFISVPGAVGSDSFTYFQIILGHFVGYLLVAAVLLPAYYRGNVVSIYHFLEARLGAGAHRTGATFFILSRTLGATARLYLVANLLQEAILDSLGVPFAVTAAASLALILAYTYRGGVKTIVWTDTLQTTFMLGGLAIIVASLLANLGLTFGESVVRLEEAGLSTVVNAEVDSKAFFAKHFVAGIFIAIAMTGMDQDMMQKSIAVRTLRDSQRNMATLAFIMLPVVLAFLYLGGLLYLYAPMVGVTAGADRILPAIVFGHLGAAIQLTFLVALIAAVFSSADGSLTAVTSSFCIDLLGLKHRRDLTEAQRTRIRHRVHLAFAAVFLALLLAFRWASSPSMIGLILVIAAYTYGPLLGLFAFGLLTRRRPADRWVPAVALAAPVICFWLDRNQQSLFGTYQVGLELLVVNGMLTFAGLWLVSRPADPQLNPGTAPA